MKTKLVVEIETPDTLEVFPEEGETEDDYIDREKELEEFRSDFASKLHKETVSKLNSYIMDGQYEEDVIIDNEECGIDGWDTFEDYGIEINIKEEK